MVLNGEPISFFGPEATAVASNPIFSSSPRAFTVSMITPRLPVTEEGWTMILSAATAT